MELGGKGREAVRSGLSPQKCPRRGGGTGVQRSSLERPVHTTHWALQPWDDPRRSQPHSYCDPTGGLGTWLLSWDMHTLLLLEQAEEAAGSCPGLSQITGQPLCPLAHRCPLSASGFSLIPLGLGPPMLGRVGSVGYRVGSDQQAVWTGQGHHRLSERGPRSSVLEISFSISLTVKSFKSLCDKDPLPHRFSDLSSAPVSPPHKLHPYQPTYWPSNIPRMLFLPGKSIFYSREI